MIRTESVTNLAKGVASTSATAIVTAPVDKYIGIKTIYIFNQHTAEITVSLYVATTTPGADDQVDAFVIQPGKGDNINIAAIILNPGEALYIKASVASKINYRVAGSTYKIA